MSIDQVQQAVAALYRGDPAANQWLTAWQQSHEAWQLSFSLVAQDQPQELQFFAATVLVRKVKADWGKLAPAQRQELHQAIRAKFGEVLVWPAPAPPVVLRQLCLLLAAAAGSGGGEGAGELVGQAKVLLAQQAQQAAQLLGLELLAALGEEAEDLDRVRRLALVSVLAPRAREVLGWLGQLLEGALQQPGAAGPAQLAAAALRCAEAWLKLSQVAGSGSILTPGELRAQQSQLFACVLSAVVGPGQPPPVVDAGLQLLLLLFGAETYSGNDEAAEKAATADALSALVLLRGRLGPGAAGAEGGDALAAGVAGVGSAVAERSPEWCSGELPQAVPFSEVILECLAREEPAVAENSLDYFLMINTVPLAERAPELRHPLYQSMLGALVHHAALPQRFTRWDEEGELDEDTFNRLREQVLPEALETGYGLLRSAYLGFAWHLLQSAPSWQQAEAALYLFNAVSMSVKARVLSDAPRAPADENDAAPSDALAAATADTQQAQQLLASLFGQLCSEEGVLRMAGGHPLLARGACSLVEGYAAWFGRAAGAPLQEAFRLCLACMRVAEAASAAAAAFHSLCLRCAWRLGALEPIVSLIDAASPLLEPQQQPQQQHPLSMASKQAIVEGLARLVAGIQPPAQQQEAAARLTQPFTAHAVALVNAHAAAAGTNGSSQGGPAPSAQARQSMAEDLQLVASALRFLAHGAGGEGEGVALQPLVRILEKVREPLQAVVTGPGWHCDEAVAAAAVEVYRRAICSARKQGAELLPAVLPPLVSLFERTGLPGCLDAVGDMLEIHYQEAQLAGALAQALGALCSAAFPRLQTDLRGQFPLASSLLSLADNFAVYSPTLLWASPLLPPLLHLAAACIALREADPVSHALGLLTQCAKAHELDGDDDPSLQQAHLEAMSAALLGTGEELVGRLLAAECDTCPRHLMRSAADLLFKLLTHPVVGAHASGWLSAALASGQLPGVASGALTSEDCSTFGGIVLGGGVRGARFAALVVDFGLLARGQNTSDVLLAYQM